MANGTPKRPKKPRPQKPPAAPFPPGEKATFGINLIQEKLIGRVIVEWSRVEAALNDMIWHLLGLSLEDGRVLTARLDAQTKIAMLQVLAPRYLEGESLDKLETALVEADTLRDDRNFIAHGNWGSLQPSSIPVALSLRAKSKPGELIGEGFPHDRMHEIIRRIIQVRKQLVELLPPVELEPSREKSE